MEKEGEIMNLICICKGITEDVIVESIKEGNDTFEKVKEDTEAGSGRCRGGRCRSRIESLILEHRK
mgnify:CR=1 FL=1